MVVSSACSHNQDHAEPCSHVQNMKGDMMQGLRRPGMQKTYQMSKSFAIHEVGKALVATVLRLNRERQGLKPRLERVERVSMVPRGRCISITG